MPVRKWRNWQTRRPQEPVGATPWEFKSPLPHQTASAAAIRAWRRAKIDGGDLQSMTTLRVQKHFATLQADGLKQVTIHKHYRVIRRFLSWCVEAGLLGAHPLQHFHMKRPKTFPYVPRDDDVERL